MTVRAKFFVEDIRHNDVPGTDQYATISMKPVFGTLASHAANVVTIPHLEARACTEVQRLGMAFGSFIETSESRILVGYVRAWLRDAFAAFTAAGVQDLIEQTRT